MPFGTAVKTAMFTRCIRRCCLCLKPCGINIEAAHIIDEAAGGSNDDDNGIPVCFDCHQMIGSYNDKHPRGNKFRPEELRARRDQVYKWVAEGMLPGLAPEVVTTTRHVTNPLHRIIELLTKYHCALDLVHHANTNEARLSSLDGWRSCHPAVWENSSVRDDTIRRLADPAKEWLSQTKCPYVYREDFNLVEESVWSLSGFAVSPSPIAIPEVYSKAHNTELQQEWDRQGEHYMAIGGLIARLKELAARAGHKWEPTS